MAKRKRDTSQKRESILDAAIQAFQEDGYDRASMDRIAEVAGASKRTVYNHFASKEALFHAVLDRFMVEIEAKKRIPYDPSRDLTEQLSDYADTKVELVSDPRWLGLMKVILAVVIRDPALAEAVIAKAQAMDNTLVAWLEAAVEDGQLQVENAELAAEVFWSMVSGALFWPQVLSGLTAPKAALELKDELIRTFLSRYRK